MLYVIAGTWKSRSGWIFGWYIAVDEMGSHRNGWEDGLYGKLQLCIRTPDVCD